MPGSAPNPNPPPIFLPAPLPLPAPGAFGFISCERPNPAPPAIAKSRKAVSDFARKNPVAALATYDIGKGILGKIMKTRMPSLQARSGFRSAKGGGGL